MAAGLGFKTFTTGEVLTAADVNGYLMQGVLVFASAAARNAAITSPQEGQFAFTKDTNGLWYYDGAAWVASGATGDIEGVTAGTGISGGGTSGTVTITNSMATEIAAKGDLIVGTGAATFDNLTVGTNDQYLVADSTASTGLKWATPSSGMTNPMTTTGDTIYSSSGSTPARLGIGTVGQVLTVNSGATAPEWTTASGGASWTLVSTSTPSGASAVDFTSISSTYSQLVVTWAGVYASANNTNFLIRLNSDSTTAYKQRELEASGTSTMSVYLGTSDNIPCMVRTTSTTETETAAGYMIIFNANSTTLNKYIETVTSYKRADTSTNVIRRASVHYDSNSAISSVNFFRGETGGTISVTSGGFIQLWGLK